MIAATSAQTNTLATAAPSATIAAPANDVALAAGATPPTATTGKPASSFNAMLAALAPQGAEPAAQPTTTRLALGDQAGEDGASTAPGEDDLAGDVAGDASLLTALAAGLTLPAIQAQLAARAATAGRGQATPATAKGGAQPAAAAPAATPATTQPAPALDATANPAASSVTPGFDIEAMFPGLTARLDGAAGAKGARGKPAAAVPAAAAATPADSVAAPAAATGATPAIAVSKVEAKHAAAPAVDALTATPAAPAPAAAPAQSPDANGTPVASAPPAADGVQTQLNVAQDGAWLDRLARDIAQSADRNAKLSFQLNPEHLGTLKVELANGADGTQVRFTADTEAARSLLADQQPRLLAEARAQGMRIADSAVALANQSAQASAGQSFQQQGQGGQRVAWTPLPVTSGSTPQTLAETAAIAPPSSERYA